MGLINLKQEIEQYMPYNEQEEQDKKVMLNYMEQFNNLLTRENEFAHFTASAWAVNPKRTKILMAYHKIYDSWAWTGGHADGESDLLETAIRELKEETGVEKVTIVKPEIYSLEIITVNGHVKRGKYVSSHLHLNLTYLLEVEESEILKVKEDENSDVKWISIEEIEQASNEGWMKKVIYEKEIEKLRKKE